jgi:hypothetical protein
VSRAARESEPNGELPAASDPEAMRPAARSAVLPERSKGLLCRMAPSGGIMVRQLFTAFTICAACAMPALASAQEPQRAVDGVIINDEGLPQYSTFSLCAIDPATGQSGAGVTTRVPFVGRAVPHVRAGVGAVCTQASTMVEYGPRGLDLLAT